MTSTSLSNWLAEWLTNYLQMWLQGTVEIQVGFWDTDYQSDHQIATDLEKGHHIIAITYMDIIVELKTMKTIQQHIIWIIIIDQLNEK